MESYPDFGGDMPLCPQSVAEHNDLSSLTWLTTVDVQVSVECMFSFILFLYMCILSLILSHVLGFAKT